MVFQLNAQIPIAYRGYDYGRSQANALRGLQMQAAEREVDEGNSLARLLNERGADLSAADPAVREAAAAAIARTGIRGYSLAAPLLEGARHEREFNAYRAQRGGGGGAAPAGAIPAAMPGAGGAGGVRTGAAIAVPAELDDADILARTILGEAANQGEVGQRAVAAVVRNRMQQTGRGVRDVVLAPSQFEPWGARRDELLRIPPTDPRYIAARRIAEQALAAGEFDDPTGGATHFLNPDLQRQLGRQQPSWAPEGQGRRIGAHVFYTPGGGVRVGQAGGDAIPASAQGGGGPQQPRMPGLPTPQQFAEMVELQEHPNPRIAAFNRRLVQTWAPFMRQEVGAGGSQAERDRRRYIELDARRDDLNPTERLELALIEREAMQERLTLGPGGVVATTPPPLPRASALQQAGTVPAVTAPPPVAGAVPPAGSDAAPAATVSGQRPAATITTPQGGTATVIPTPPPAQRLDGPARTQLLDIGSRVGSLDRLARTFNPRFGGFGSENVGQAVATFRRTVGDSSGMAQWWQDYQDFKNAIRNELFGAALTATEKAEFDRAAVNPGMAPSQIAENLTRQVAIARGAARRRAAAMIADGFNPAAVEAAIGIPLASLGLTGDPNMQPGPGGQGQAEPGEGPGAARPSQVLRFDRNGRPQQ